MAHPLHDDPVYGSFFAEPTPHVAALGIEVVEAADRRVVMRLPFRPELVGNPESGALHGGAVYTLIDTDCGFLAMASIQASGADRGPVATLDLRVDYLRAAGLEQALTAEAVCTRITHQVVFCRARAWQADPEAPVAEALGSFMIANPGERREIGAP